MGFIPRMKGQSNTQKPINVTHHINRRKNHVIISINIERAFDKLQHLKWLKTPDRLGREANYLKTIKAVYEKLMINIFLFFSNIFLIMKNWGFSSETRNKAKMSTVVISIQYSRAIRWEKKINGIQIWNEEIKFYLFADNMIIYTEDPTASTKKKKKRT